MMLEPGLLTLSASSPEQGTTREELDDKYITFEEGNLEIGFQARYLNDITDQVEKDVEFAFSDSASPTIVRDADSPEVLYVLMPMRV